MGSLSGHGPSHSCTQTHKGLREWTVAPPLHTHTHTRRRVCFGEEGADGADGAEHTEGVGLPARFRSRSPFSSEGRGVLRTNTLLFSPPVSTQGNVRFHSPVVDSCARPSNCPEKKNDFFAA